MGKVCVYSILPTTCGIILNMLLVLGTIIALIISTIKRGGKSSHMSFSYFSHLIKGKLLYEVVIPTRHAIECIKMK